MEIKIVLHFGDVGVVQRPCMLLTLGAIARQPDVSAPSGWVFAASRHVQAGRKVGMRMERTDRDGRKDRATV